MRKAALSSSQCIEIERSWISAAHIKHSTPSSQQILVTIALRSIDLRASYNYIDHI